MGVEAYNKHLNMFIYILDGEELCPQCGGKGVVPLKQVFKTKRFKSLICSRCGGRGKIDWVQKVMQK